MNNEKLDYLKVYQAAHGNAVDLLSEAKILFEKEKYPRAYFLAFTALEEISKSQQAADVFTGFSKEEDFLKLFRNHTEKIDRVAWAHFDSNCWPYNQMWIGPDQDDVEQVAPEEPLWSKRQNSLYVNVIEDNIICPKDNILENDAKEIIHMVEVALHRIWEVTEYWGHQIGTKGFMK